MSASIDPDGERPQRSRIHGGRSCWALLLLSILLALPGRSAGQQTTGVGADSAAVAQTLERFVRAFNNLEWNSFREHFADDATVFFPLRSSRMRADGRAELEAVFGELFRSARSSGSGPPYLDIRPRDVRIQMLGEAAVATFHLGADDEPSVGRRTLVLRRDADGGWRMVHLHASALDREESSPAGADAAQAVENALRGYLDAYVAQDPEAWREHITRDFLLIENGYPLEPDRFTAAWDPEKPLTQSYRLHDLHIEVVGEVALYRFGLGWYEGDERVVWAVETGHARLGDGEWRLALNHFTALPPRAEVDTRTLTEYVGQYRGLDASGREDRLILVVEDDRLYFRRPGGGAVVYGVGEVEVIPGPGDLFFVEFVNGRMQFERGDDGTVEGFVYTLSIEVPPGIPERLRYAKVR